MTLLAHQGGWDEALFVAVPLLLLGGLLWLAYVRQPLDEADEHDSLDDLGEDTSTDLP